MGKLTIDLKNCYGIQSLKHEFDFSIGTGNKRKPAAYAIYAPNGIMKTSFSRTFEDLSKGNLPKEERYKRTTTCVVDRLNCRIESGCLIYDIPIFMVVFNKLLQTSGFISAKHFIMPVN